MVPGERVGPERYVKASDVEPMMQLEIAEAVAVAVQSATDKLLDAVLSNLTKVATGEMRVVNPNPVVLPFRTTKDCWQWMTEQKERREQAETVAQIRLEHIQGLMAERDAAREAVNRATAEAMQTWLLYPPVKLETVRLDDLEVQERIAKLQLDKDELQKLTITQGREIVGLTDQVQRQSGMIKEGWDRIDTLADELAQARKAQGEAAERVMELTVGARHQRVAPPPVEHVHDQNERVRQRATDEIKCELSKAFPAQFSFYAGHCE